MTDIRADYDSWAWLYDRTLGPDYRDRKMGFLERALLAGLAPGARILDLCCGAGQMAAPMAARGFAVTGIDISPDMLRHARRNAPDATFLEGDARDFRLDAPVAGAVCASASLNHMEGPADLARVFACVHGALEPGGVFVFDVNHPAQMARHWRGRPAAGEIRADYAWMITPRYDAASASGAFRVDMHRRPQEAPPEGSPLWLALLNRPFLSRTRLRRLAGFAERRPDWEHRRADYPVRGHDLGTVLDLLAAAGFDARIETLSGRSAVDENTVAAFVCRRLPEAEIETEIEAETAR